jgi:starch phosphorylase
VALQLNDTHPTIGVPELMRLLMDVHGLGWTQSWDITTRVFSFTNHTVLPEALEKWPVELVETVLPRHMQIIYDINWRFTQELRGIMGDDFERIGRMSIIEDGEGMDKSVRMAHLALVASHTVNGVAAIHSELIKTTIFKDFYDIMPEKFQNKTNGVTPRRWLAFCNPPLSALISETLGTDAWIKELDLLQGLRPHATDPKFQKRWADIKLGNKQRLADLVKEQTGVDVPVNALFDIQVKRIHEYKRQLLNIFGIVHRYKPVTLNPKP